MTDPIRRAVLAGVWVAAVPAKVAAIDLPRLSANDLSQRFAGRPIVLMMRHEQTEAGVGDPPNFRVDDCSTQRNLSAEGRRRATDTGARLRAADIHPSRVLSSRWCRCLDTARLAFGTVEPWQALDSFFAEPARQAPQREQWLVGLQRYPGGAPWMLVTHQVNISAFLGVWTTMGEIVAAERRGDRWVPVARV